MNRLPREKRARILHQLVEGVGLRAISRLEDVSINTVTKLLVDAGNACAAYHDEHVRNVHAERIQVDELWSFVYAKQANVAKAKKAPAGAGDAWIWKALDADNKLIVSWFVGPRDSGSAFTFMHDLKDRLAGRVQLTSDGLAAYPGAVELVFGADVDYSQLIKHYTHPIPEEARYSPPVCTGTTKKRLQGNPDEVHISTSYVERSNLNLRMGVRRFTRLTNAFGKKLENQVHALALWLVYYNFVRMHKTLRMTPAMAAGLTDTLHDMGWLADLVEDARPEPVKPGPPKGAKYRPRKNT